ncbi:unnamed protein product [Cyprideis torosa]|uniref:Uncharacterized protein n=1 Tax=Cyprideis torosa TaxID=163714 RepID=A0A7R8ZMZ6_9CRUS|nr:unnamed protein product [Cyprideis torosa]CAG0896775.1 unnamed protein product [Cyprideis torosa]
MMSEDPIDLEIQCLEREYRWVLDFHAEACLRELDRITKKCEERFPVLLKTGERPPKEEKFILSSQQSTSVDQLKCIVTVQGDAVTHADVTLKLSKLPNQVFNTQVMAESPWRLPQIQDAGNYLRSTRELIQDAFEKLPLATGDQANQIFTKMVDWLLRARTALLQPKSRTIEEVLTAKNMADPRRFHCPNPFCGRRYIHRKHLNSHLKYECGVEPQFRCNQCAKSFRHKKSLKSHLLLMHGNFYSCDSVGSCVSSDGHAPIAIASTCPAAPSDNIFGSNAASSPNLQTAFYSVEIYKNSSGRWQCYQCPRSYVQKGHLVHHLRFECNVQPQFQCPVCMKCFKQKGHLKSHAALVHKHRPYSAEIVKSSSGRWQCFRCSRSYAQKKHLLDHLRFECNVQPQFQCPVCHRYFSRKGNLRAHAGVVHKCHIP